VSSSCPFSVLESDGFGETSACRFAIGIPIRLVRPELQAPFSNPRYLCFKKVSHGSRGSSSIRRNHFEGEVLTNGWQAGHNLS
jgi:hypothetical protein